MNTIPLFKVFTPPNIGSTIQKVWDDGMVTEGVYSDKFEREFSSFIENEHTLLLNSGTTALSLAYHMIGLGEGDEVITSPMTCAATNEPLVHCGATIVWADVDPATGNLCPEDVARKITPRTKAVVGVHWGGVPFDSDALRAKIGEDIWIVEDCAHAFGAKYNGRPVGKVSGKTMACFSFQAIKHLTTGDGGALAVSSKSLYDRGKKLRWFGLDRTFVGPKWTQDIVESGFKYHMNNMNAAIGLLQMQDIRMRLTKYNKNAIYYNKNISNPKVRKPVVAQNVEPSWWLYTVQVDDPQALKTHLEARGIASDIVHVRNDNYTCFNYCKRPNLPGVKEFDERHLCIPIGWWLGILDYTRVVKALNEF